MSCIPYPKDIAQIVWDYLEFLFATLNSPIVVGRNFLESTLILLVRVNVGHIDLQPMLNFLQKNSMGHNNCFLESNWVIIRSFVTFDISWQFCFGHQSSQILSVCHANFP